jgi:hypothetical protein
VFEGDCVELWDTLVETMNRILPNYFNNVQYRGSLTPVGWREGANDPTKVQKYMIQLKFDKNNNLVAV